MGKIATLEQVGRSVGVSKQMVIKYIKKKWLRRNKQNKIDIEDKHNIDFLESKGCDFSTFYGTDIPELVRSVDRSDIKPKINIEKKPEKKQKVIQKQEEKPLKLEKTEQNNIKKETKEDENSIYELEKLLKLETIKAKQLDSSIKKIKIEEANARLIPRDLAERYINDTIGAIQQSFVVIPSSIVEIIFNIYENHPEDRREQVVKLLQEKYTKEAKKLIQKAKDRHRKAIQDQIEKADEEQES